ncbi:hypothetical protein DPMN_059542 [Dreissena polymorpha]|uniref:Uncharacterized protein n=1 Tax=Dreissena polymorpha TaxID=45954 RepID=A0A9D4C3N9_DREPO|nr:hypothetical protein DPMN_059542 [Dreissena polymorpha]
MSLFGKDIGNNICAFITFADRGSPPVIAALDKSKLPFGERFIFNDSGLFASNNKEENNKSTMFWEMGFACFKHFFKHLDTLAQRSLQLTTDVLNERRRLEVTVQKLQSKLDAGRMIWDQLKNVIQLLEENKKIIADNKNFTFKEKKTKIKKYDLPKGQHVMNCCQCNYTCHESCTCANDEEKQKCSAMDKDGNCTVCPDKCYWSKHVAIPYVIKYENVEVTGNYTEMKLKYETAAAKQLKHEQLLDNMREELEVMRTVIEDMMLVIYDCNKKLAKIALHPSLLYMTDHIDLMIEDEKVQKKQGFLARIESLNIMKMRALVFENGKTFLEQSCTVVSDTESGSVKQKGRSLKDVFKLFLNDVGL